MKKSILIALVFVALGSFMFTSCNTDTTGPKLYWYNSDGEFVLTGDTTILLYTEYVDPGVYVEDNVSKEENIKVENDAEAVLGRYITNDGYLRRAGDFTIKYTAEDEAGNISEYFRIISIKNIVDPFVKTYTTTRNANHLRDTIYRSNVAADNNKPGRLRFPKVYAHTTLEGHNTYFRVNADLFDPVNLSTTASDAIGFMGTKSDKDTPFFKDMTYEQGVDTALSFVMLKIDAQTYEDTAGFVSVLIRGVTEQGTGLPKSRIEYLANSKEVIRIVLELNVTRSDGIVDVISEIYIPAE